MQTEERKVKVLSSMMVDLTSYVDVDPKEVGGVLAALGTAATLLVKVIQDWKK